MGCQRIVKSLQWWKALSDSHTFTTKGHGAEDDIDGGFLLGSHDADGVVVKSEFVNRIRYAGNSPELLFARSIPSG